MKAYKIPWFPRLTLTIIEPLMSLNGARLCFQDPQKLISSYLTRGAVSYDPATQTLYTQLAGFWIFFAFVEVFILGAARSGGRDDLNLWRRVCLGMLVSDLVYYLAAAQGVGGWAEFLDVRQWGFDEAAVTLGSLWPCLTRVYVIFFL